MGTNAPPSRLEDWAKYSTMRLETRKRDGSWVATPVSLVMHDGRMFFRTYRQSGKAKRLRNFTAVRTAPCSFLGEPKADPSAGFARLLDEHEVVEVRRHLRRRHPFLHGILVPLAHRVMRYDTQHYELTIAESD
jgi:PPOX class probable F420-dependent enzyme